ncbi:hypothetical protein AT960_11160 [Priestia megaterium]|uniref:glycosyltransferase family 4 protein n=1 Tax=Priestia megaterium TaxID=1404 RepID=UPI0007C4F7F3|nr:glycosyltransferase family 4 protein [Priestia megaterium]MCI4621424.1 glycosyltransferase family 4 protein [Priestia megaterium]OAD47917.1 hypothetical protein AT960_11160 [Priestia megaterium]
MKKILVVNHFPTVYPPISGGTIRYFHLYNELSYYYDITLLSQTYKRKGGIFHFSSTFREYRVEVDSYYYNILKDTQSSEATYEDTLITNTQLSELPTVYKKYFNQLYETHEIIVHESPYLLGYDCYLGLDNKPRIYNSHNHEYRLANQIWQNKQARKFLPAIYQLEYKLTQYSNLIFTTCEMEKRSLISMFNLDPKKVKVAPNGVSPNEWIYKEKKTRLKPMALFIGTDYPPNNEAVSYIIHHLSDKCPDVEFIIAGACCNNFLNFKKSNVTLLGRVTHKQKLKLFACVDIAINPMFTGAGVNLKTLEFLSAGIPLFSTYYGARGLNLIDKKHYIHAEKENFADKINDFIFNQRNLKQISFYGRKYINKHYSWSNIAKNMYEQIENMIIT